ncbi:cysteine protease ATG4 [Skeletonema marinoi]|uniref:Cysteine protease n=1 Tax=Skeletonema marinoi TaxID=267567 RepID=A0AAD9DE24_9STRA|nr:cysteine protease ATG4 [Skeletonema marinoi]
MAPPDDDEIAHCPTTEGMLELDNLHLNNGAKNTAVVHDDSRDDSDVDSDDDDNDGISSSYHPAQHDHDPNNTAAGSSITTAYCLGYSFLRADHVTMRSFQKSLYWFTYRNDLVVPLRPYRPPVQSFAEDSWEVERIARWFADFPGHIDINENPGDDDYSEEYGKGGINNHWYSLHQMVAAGLGLGVLPGEWYGPTTACHVLRELNEIHCEMREELAKKLVPQTIQHPEDGTRSSQSNSLSCDMFRVHMPRRGSDAEATESSHPLSTPQTNEINDPLRAHLANDTASQSSPRNGSNRAEKDVAWDTSLLLLLPLRLGIQKIDSSKYGSTLAKLMSFPQSVGMLGGTPRHALWFYGADAVDPGNDQDCGGWYGLDPHTVQMAPRGTQTLIETGNSSDDPKYQWDAQILKHIFTNASHFNHDRAIPLSGLDTSCALGFYLKDYSDFCQFTSLLDALAKDHCRPNQLPEIITVAEKTPNYEDGVTSAMKDMVDNDDDGLDDFSVGNEEIKEEEETDDEDDFVLI